MQVPMAVWVGGVISLFIFVITNLCVSVWWASRLSTIVETLSDELKDIAIELRASRGVYATKEEVARELAISEKEHAAIWKRLDEIRSARTAQT